MLGLFNPVDGLQVYNNASVFAFNVAWLANDATEYLGSARWQDGIGDAVNIYAYDFALNANA